MQLPTRSYLMLKPPNCADGSTENIFGMGKATWPHILNPVLMLPAKDFHFFLFKNSQGLEFANVDSFICLLGSSFQTISSTWNASEWIFWLLGGGCLQTLVNICFGKWSLPAMLDTSVGTVNSWGWNWAAHTAYTPNVYCLALCKESLLTFQHAFSILMCLTDFLIYQNNTPHFFTIWWFTKDCPSNKNKPHASGTWSTLSLAFEGEPELTPHPTSSCWCPLMCPACSIHEHHSVTSAFSLGAFLLLKSKYLLGWFRLLWLAILTLFNWEKHLSSPFPLVL